MDKVTTGRRQLLKIIVVGDSGVGKTSLMNQYVHKRFDTRYKATIGADFLAKELEINGRVVTVQIWDTAGQERFQSLGSAFYRGADACLLVFDVTQQESFAHVGSWLEEFSIQAGCRDCVLIGNKTDLEERRQVASKTAQAWCAKQNAEAANSHMAAGAAGSAEVGEMKYFEASAKEDAGVADAFLAVARLALSKKGAAEETVPQPQTVSLTQTQPAQTASSGACNC